MAICKLLLDIILTANSLHMYLISVLINQQKDREMGEETRIHE